MRLIGRGIELQAGRRRLASGGWCLVTGPPGVGKTSLLRACAAESERTVREWDLRDVVSLRALDRWLARRAALPRSAPADVVVAEVRAGLVRAGVDFLHVEAFELEAEALARLAALGDAGTLWVAVSARRAPGADVHLGTLPPREARQIVEQEALRRLTTEEVDAIVRRSDGLPLSLRLLARLVSLTGIPRGREWWPPRLDEYAGPLLDGYGAIAERLGDDGRRAWARLASFAGAFEEEDALAVGVGADALAELRAWSLVEPRRERGGTLALLDSARDFARETFERSLLDEGSRRHRALFVGMVHELELLPFGPRTPGGLARADAKRADLELALARCPGEDLAGDELCLALDLLDGDAFPLMRRTRLRLRRVRLASVGRPMPATLLNREAFALAELGELKQAEMLQRRALRSMESSPQDWRTRIRSDSFLLLASQSPAERHICRGAPRAGRPSTSGVSPGALAYEEMALAHHLQLRLGRTKEALAHARRALTLARRARHGRLEAAMVCQAVRVFINVAAPSEFEGLLVRARALAQQYGLTYWEADLAGAAARWSLEGASVKSCEEAFRKAIELYSRSGHDRGGAVHLGYWGLADLWFQRGDPSSKLGEAAASLGRLGLPAAAELFTCWSRIAIRVRGREIRPSPRPGPRKLDRAPSLLPEWEARLLEQLCRALQESHHTAALFEQVARDADAVDDAVDARFTARLARRLARQRFRYWPHGFSDGGAEVVALRSRPVLLRLYGALYEAARETPGEPASVEALAARTWPDTEAPGGRMRKRLRDNVRELRKLGLGEALVRDPRGGYRLDVELGRCLEAPRRRRG